MSNYIGTVRYDDYDIVILEVLATANQLSFTQLFQQFSERPSYLCNILDHEFLTLVRKLRDKGCIIEKNDRGDSYKISDKGRLLMDFNDDYFSLKKKYEKEKGNLMKKYQYKFASDRG